MATRVVLFAAILALSSPALAQEALPTTEAAQAQNVPSTLTDAVKVGQDVIIKSDDGTKTRGIIMRVTPESLTLVQGELEGAVPTQRIARIQKVDPWWHGAVVGAGLGLITTAVMVHDCHKRDDECRSIAKGFGLIFVTPPATLIGALVDRLTQKTLFQR